jgi:glycosyltransferase involved in cell wall biosynthesis
LASVRAQTFSSWELIVVDDGWEDPDRLFELVGGPPARVIRHAPAGIARSRNHGIYESLGALLAFLDHDDLWRPDHLERLVAPLAQEPAAVLSFGGFDIIDGSGARISDYPYRAAVGPVTAEDVLSGGPRPAIPSMVARKDKVVMVGGFDPLLEPADDLDLIYKLAMEGRFAAVEAVTSSYRRHESNRSGDVIGDAEAFDRMVSLHEQAAVAQGNQQLSTWFQRNRRAHRDWFVATARRQAAENLKSGNSRRARELYRWCWQFSRQSLVRDLATSARRRMARVVASRSILKKATGLNRRLSELQRSRAVSPTRSKRRFS